MLQMPHMVGYLRKTHRVLDTIHMDLRGLRGVFMDVSVSDIHISTPRNGF